MLTRERVLSDIAALPQGYKTADIDRLISGYVKQKEDASLLRGFVLKRQELHRIYFYVSLKQIKGASERIKWIDNNLLFEDWWHTDELIDFVKELDQSEALMYARKYTLSPDPFIRRWGYVMFISKLCRNEDKLYDILSLMRDDEHYYVQMGEAWLIAELCVFFPEKIYDWMSACPLKYNIAGKAIQKICDSFRIDNEVKLRFKELREKLKQIK